MITNLEIKSIVHNKCIFKAKSDIENNYVLQFCPHGSSGPTKDSPIIDMILNQNKDLISHDIELERGLYDVYVSVLKQINPVSFGDTEKYFEPIMIGEKYIVYLYKTLVECYGEAGLHIKLISNDEPIGNKDIYYHISGHQVDEKKYYIPFNDCYEINFFVQGVDKTEISFIVENPKFEIIESVDEL